jgi:hypothetical protein
MIGSNVCPGEQTMSTFDAYVSKEFRKTPHSQIGRSSEN